MRDAWFRLDANRRFAVLALAAGLVLLAVLLMKRASAPDYVTLFRELDLAEVGNITDQLGKASIQYQLGNGGSEVRVPLPDAARARVLLAKVGLPANGRPGLELFDRPSWGMTDFTQHITYRRALEGELARTIGTLRGVTRAQVHLALPEESPIRAQQRPPEAAVVVSMQPNTSLSDDQVRGITQLVAGSVEQLTADHVVVLDDSGRPLTGAGDGEGAALTAHQLDLQQGVEEHLATKVEQLLSSAVGPSDVKVQVAARLNFDQVERTIEAYDPAGKVLSNEQRSQSAADSTPGDAAGTVINNTYLNSRKIEKIIGETGNVTRLTVSVMLNTRALKPDAAAQEDQRTSLTQLVRNAIGIDSSRGDQLSVVAVAFSDPVPVKVSPADTAAIRPSTTDTLARFSIPAVALLAVIVALVLGLRMLRMSGAPRALTAGSTNPALAGASDTLALGDAGGLRTRMQAESASSPDAAARVIRAWLGSAS
ncbi:MAG TPA: flagellar basal-body MS-ring/collar protein FliF [Gemmatimonadales bacterium]|jgi:flagellar M-ring protein FliF